MNNLHTSFSVDFSNFVSDLPELKKEKFYSSIIFENSKEENKKEIVLEVPSLNLTFDQFLFSHLNMIENRFWLYNYLNSIHQNTYSYNFKFMDLSRKAYIFNSKKLKSVSLNSGFFLYNSRKFFLSNSFQKTLSKHRILFLNKKGYSLSFVGNRANLLKSFLLKKKKEQKSYSSLFIANLNLIGYLNSFALQKWEVKCLKRSKASKLSSFLKKYNFYYKKNLVLKSFLTLKK